MEELKNFLITHLTDTSDSKKKVKGKTLYDIYVAKINNPIGKGKFYKYIEDNGYIVYRSGNTTKSSGTFYIQNQLLSSP